MLGAHLYLGSSGPGFGAFTDQSASISPTRNSLAHCSGRLSPRSSSLRLNPAKLKRIYVNCKYSPGNFGPKSHHEAGQDYLEASLLIAETVKHYHLLKHGFREDKWQLSGHLLRSSHSDKGFRPDGSSLGLDFLRRFETPTIFLKISCDGDFLLPIFVGEFAIERLIDSLVEDESGECSNQYQYARNFVAEAGYQVQMIKITERVDNTYFSRIYFSKVGQRASFSIDARPSDAVNVARRCKAPIYVNKRVVLADAIRITFRTGRVHDMRPCYDVVLDSASESPDSLAEELGVVMNMNLAINEERYYDAAMWRDKLWKLRKSDANY